MSLDEKIQSAGWGDAETLITLAKRIVLGCFPRQLLQALLYLLHPYSRHPQAATTSRISNWVSFLLLTVLTCQLPALAEEKRYEPFYAFAFNPEFIVTEDALQLGSAKAYLTEDFNFYRSYELQAVSAALKQTLWDSATDNPFINAYTNIYKTDTAQSLQDCGFWGQVQVDLDSNDNTREWLLAASLVLCLPENYQHIFRFGDMRIDKTPHIWLLQKGKDSYRVLVEGDGGMVITNKDTPAGAYREVISLLKEQPLPGSRYSCGETELRWHYRDGRYEAAESLSKATGCSRAYNYGEYEEFTGDKEMTEAAARSASFEMQDNDEKHLVEIRQKAQDFLEKLGFAAVAAGKTTDAVQTQATTVTDAAKAESPDNEVAATDAAPRPPAPTRTAPVKDNFDLEKLIKSGVLDELLKP